MSRIVKKMSAHSAGGAAKHVYRRIGVLLVEADGQACLLGQQVDPPVSDLGQLSKRRGRQVFSPSGSRVLACSQHLDHDVPVGA